MQRILIVSDTHGMCDKVIRLMENVPFDMVIHLGDIQKDALYIKKAFPEIPLEYVIGNNDYIVGDREKIIEIGKYKIFLCHGHTYSVSASLLSLSLRAKELNADLALFGHTHKKEDTEYNDVRIFNPGSPSRPRDYEASVGILEIDKDYFGLCHYNF